MTDRYAKGFCTECKYYLCSIECEHCQKCAEDWDIRAGFVRDEKMA